MIEITSDPINIQKVFDAVQSDEAGATVLFSGSTRRWTGDKETARLEYECYREMAISETKKLVEHAFANWRLTSCAVIHRIGVVEIGEISVAIAVSSPHRDAAFEAGRWLIDTLKQVVPIWKKENWTDGKSEWVHPGGKVDSSDQQVTKNQIVDQGKSCP